MASLKTIIARRRSRRQTTTPAPVFQGPVQPGVSESVFRETGVSVKGPVVQGPTRPGTNVVNFRTSGGGGSGGGGSSSSTPTTSPSISVIPAQTTTSSSILLTKGNGSSNLLPRIQQQSNQAKLKLILARDRISKFKENSNEFLIQRGFIKKQEELKKPEELKLSRKLERTTFKTIDEMGRVTEIPMRTAIELGYVRPKTSQEQGDELVEFLLLGAGATPFRLLKTGAPVKLIFSGTQKQVGNKIITDLKFINSNGKRVGFAKGVTLQKGAKGYTIVAGQSGVKGIKFPSGKLKIGKIESFVGTEASFTKAGKVRVEQKLGDNLKVIRNLPGQNSFAVGNSISVKGNKFMQTRIKSPSGKIVNKKVSSVRFDKFASVSSSLTRGDLNIITGKSITAKGGQAEFAGIIRNIRNTKSVSGGGKIKIKSGSLSKKQKLQFKTALDKVVAVTSSASSKVNTISGLSNTQKTALSVGLIKESIKKSGNNPTTATIIKNINNQKVSPKIFSETQTRQSPKTRTQTRQSPKTRTQTRQSPKTRTQTRQSPKTRTQTRQSPKTRTQTRQSPRQILKQKQIIKTTSRGIQTPRPRKRIRGVIPPIIPRIKNKKIGKKIIMKPQAYNVFAKQKGKFIKVTKKPLSPKNSLDRLAYIVDHSTGVTVKRVPVRRTKKLGSIKTFERGAYKKARSYIKPIRTIRGKKIQTPNRYIESRGRPRINTRGEKRGLSVARLNARLNKPVIKRKAVRNNQLYQLRLKNLSKARRVLKRRRK